MYQPTSLPEAATRRATHRVALPSLHRSSEGHGYSAGFGSRALALALDAGLFVLTAPFTLAIASLVLQSWWPLGALMLAVGYCWLSNSRGQSLGMQLAGVRVLSARTCRPVTPTRALLRSLFVLVPATGAVVLLNAAVPGGASSTGESPTAVPSAVLLLASAVVGLGLADIASGLLDSQRRSLHDRLLGTVVVDARVATNVLRSALRHN